MAKARTADTLLGFDPHILFDLVVRVILALFFAFAAGIYIRNAIASLHNADMHHWNAASLSQGLSIFAASLYTLMIASLYVLRLRPVNKFAGWWPSTAAILGGFLMFGLIMFKPRTDLPLTAQVIASVMVLLGNLLSAIILTRLGRSFSILPEGRKLVTKGPYKYVRHPLYLAEALASFGTMIVFLSPGAVILVLAQTVLQFVRMHYEERVLTKTFPAYKKYAKQTSRLIPGVY
ncbi:MAG TPA: isoprenylcysteine carboxylmethyltransferase family protein [Alphaproteobacteria bacterium]|nr:isoprenylcysteine carboxylmethyltransferase family protein [Alphaproteobacteria bacterium]